MASNRNSICDIWSQKNHQLRQRNSKFHSRARCIFPFQTSTSFHLQFCSPVEKRPNWSEKFAIVCNQRPVWKIPTWRKWKYQTYSNRSEFTLIKNGMGLQKIQHFSGKHLWGKCKIYISRKSCAIYIFWKYRGTFLWKERYIFLCGKISIDQQFGQPLTVGQMLRAASGPRANLLFLWKISKAWFNFETSDKFLLNAGAIHNAVFTQN